MQSEKEKLSIERGASLLEYAILIMLLALVGIISSNVISGRISTQFSKLASLM